MTPAFARPLVHGHAVAVAITADDERHNHPDERAAAARFGPSRAAEYLAGRRALRHAIAAVAAPTRTPIGADVRGAPAVPAGVVGSISHKGALAIAVAALDDGWTLGVDLERQAPRTLDLRRKVLTADEQAALAGATDDAIRRAVVRAFSIKEAVYKAIDPFLRRYVGFLEVALEDTATGVRVVAPAAWGLDIEAAVVAHDDYWIATARARRGSALTVGK